MLQTRLNGLLGLRRRVLPATPGGGAERDTARIVEQWLAAIPRFDGMLRALLDGMIKGFAVVELLWGYDPQGRVVVADWIAHPQEWFAFDEAGALMLLVPPFRAEEDPAPAPDPLRNASPMAGRATTPAQSVRPAPDRKFIVLRFGADVRNPYGRGLAQRAYWLYWFKKNTLKWWAIHNEKYGSPTAVARCGPGITREEQRDLAAMLDALQTESGIVVPESVRLELLESARTGSASTYRDFLDWCNDEMSKVVLGATLTSGEGRRSGSLALGSIHETVRRDYIEADARLLEEVVNDTLVRWLCGVNLGDAIAPPRWTIDAGRPVDLAQRIAVDHELLALGVPLPISYFYEQYGRPAPTDIERPLQFDDANFYKYHLQFGVLTINEVRHRLGLEPVAWGDTRTAEPGGEETPAPDDQDSSEDTGRRQR